MSKEDKDIFGGFEHIADYMNKTEVGVDSIAEGDDTPYAKDIDPEDLEKQLGGTDENDEDLEIDEEIEESDEEEIEDDENIDEEDINSLEDLKKLKDAKDENPAVEDVEETEIVDDFVDLFSSELGWEIEEEHKPKDIKGLIQFMSNIIDENSVPTYANEEIQKIDEFVRNGGNLRKYFEETSPKQLNLDSPNLEDENTQKQIVAEYLKTLNYNDKQIEKRLNRYEEAGTLEEEAEEAVELLKEHVKVKEEKLLKDQKERKQLALKEQQKFISDVESKIEALEDIQGIPLSKKDRQELQDYLFKVESDGKTAYQKDYSKDITNLIVSAYFTKNGKKLYKKMQQKAESDAVLRFKKNLKNKRKPKQQKPYESGGAHFGDTLSAISKVLAKN